MIKVNVITAISEFHGHGRLPRGTDASFLMLTLKKDNPQDLGEFRPIFLIGCL